MTEKSSTPVNPEEMSKASRKLGHVMERNQDVLKTQQITKSVEKVKKLYDKALKGDETAARRLAGEGIDTLKETKEKVEFGMEEQFRMDDESPAPIPEEVEDIKHDYEETHRRLTQALPASCQAECAEHDVHPEKIRK